MINLRNESELYSTQMNWRTTEAISCAFSQFNYQSSITRHRLILITQAGIHILETIFHIITTMLIKN